MGSKKSTEGEITSTTGCSVGGGGWWRVPLGHLRWVFTEVYPLKSAHEGGGGVGAHMEAELFPIFFFSMSQMEQARLSVARHQY